MVILLFLFALLFIVLFSAIYVLFVQASISELNEDEKEKIENNILIK